MSKSKETLIKRYESTADTYQEKGDREWAYAKNDLGDEHYGKAKKAYEKANRKAQLEVIHNWYQRNVKRYGFEYNFYPREDA